MRNLAASIIDSGAPISPGDAYMFLSPSGTVTVTGYYVSREGSQTGLAFELDIPVGDGTNDPVTWTDGVYLGGTDPVVEPTDAVGVEAVFPSDVYYAKCNGKATETADFKANYASYGQVVATTPIPNTFGRA